LATLAARPRAYDRIDQGVYLYAGIHPLKEDLMKRFPRTASLGIALLAFAINAMAKEPPRVYVDGVAKVLEENYFDEARAGKIAAE